ncbi:predicted protein [Nematostella vectensis]|uniref:HEPN domain-containing protein n=1 Tax=Nematostella vectensis TaxID=45351 RepID=A7STW7_NEMVE|nr:predicted protein [Nematostella vectensis]|eukprot:XP_001624955.1 predicted protein [Nematostella vectensis]
MDPGLDSGMDPGLGSGMDPGMDSEINPGMDPGLDPGMDPGLDSELDPGLDSGMDPGLDSGMDPGLDSRLDPGMDPDLPNTLMEMFIMTLGELNYGDKFRPWANLSYPYLINILFFLFALTMPIILMNMLSSMSSNVRPSRRQKKLKISVGRATADNQVDVDLSLEGPAWKISRRQAAEKALKAAQFSLDATNVRIHDLHMIASCLDDSTLRSLAVQLEGLVGNSMRMRYPDCMVSPRIPHDVYTRQQSRDAYCLAKKILNRVRERFF